MENEITVKIIRFTMIMAEENHNSLTLCSVWKREMSCGSRVIVPFPLISFTVWKFSLCGCLEVALLVLCPQSADTSSWTLTYQYHYINSKYFCCIDYLGFRYNVRSSACPPTMGNWITVAWQVQSLFSGHHLKYRRVLVSQDFILGLSWISSFGNEQQHGLS